MSTINKTGWHGAIVLFLLVCVPILQHTIVRNREFEFINLCIAAISSVVLFSYRNEPYSLHKIINLFFLFFLCIAPSIQYKENVQMLGTFFYVDEYITTSYYILFILIGYNIFYWAFRRICAVSQNIVSDAQQPLQTGEVLKLMIVSSAICFLFLSINNFNLISLFVRDGEITDRQDLSQIEFLIYEYFLRPMPMIIFLVTVIRGVSHKIVHYVLFILFLFACPLTGIARFSAASLYLPVCLCLSTWLRRGANFIYSFIIGLLVIFPVLNLFRQVSGSESFETANLYSQFLDMNFDAFSMFMRVLRDEIVTDGRQLLGVLLFFVPRSIWPDKPVGSGTYVAESTNLSYSNVSMPFWAEGYINFGIVGIALFLLIISYFTAKSDKIYWMNKGGYNNSQFIKYAMSLGLIFFMMRGDLLSSFAYFCGFMVSYYTITRVILQKQNK